MRHDRISYSESISNVLWDAEKANLIKKNMLFWCTWSGLTLTFFLNFSVTNTKNKPTPLRICFFFSFSDIWGGGRLSKHILAPSSIRMLITHYPLRRSGGGIVLISPTTRAMRLDAKLKKQPHKYTNMFYTCYIHFSIYPVTIKFTTFKRKIRNIQFNFNCTSEELWS